jgi:hypothetical protein
MIAFRLHLNLETQLPTTGRSRSRNDLSFHFLTPEPSGPGLVAGGCSCSPSAFKSFVSRICAQCLSHDPDSVEEASLTYIVACDELALL